jgi:hypothetical protein
VLSLSVHTMTVLEHIKQLSEALSAEEKQSLAAYLSSREGDLDRRPRDLYGIWKNGFPGDFDIDAALREIRGEWQKEVKEIIP